MCKGRQWSNAAAIIINRSAVDTFYPQGFQNTNSTRNTQAVDSIFNWPCLQGKQLNQTTLFAGCYHQYHIIKAINQIAIQRKLKNSLNKILTKVMSSLAVFMRSIGDYKLASNKNDSRFIINISGKQCYIGRNLWIDKKMAHFSQHEDKRKFISKIFTLGS